MRRSLFRPVRTPDPAMLDSHRTLIRSIERRALLRGGLSLGALTMLTGCDVSDDGSIHQGLLAMSRFNDWVQAALFDPNRLAPEYPVSMVQKPPRYNAYFPVENVKPIDGETWRLEVSGLVANKQPWTLAQINALPVREEIIRHVCVEGWDYIGQWSGPTLRSFLEKVGADMTAKYVVFRTVDDYLSCIDMPTALHPQTLLATKYAGETLPDPFGFPIRLRTAVKLGFKNPKWITAIEVSNAYQAGYWESRGSTGRAVYDEVSTPGIASITTSHCPNRGFSTMLETAAQAVENQNEEIRDDAAGRGAHPRARLCAVGTSRASRGQG